MFHALDKKYSATNAARLRQLLRDCQAISTQKNVPVMEKYEAKLNLHAEIRVQNKELAFHDAHLINYLWPACLQPLKPSLTISICAT
ncbi:hypothetical protein MMC07_001719, partial [Pseudocyphellaria aurata]|nr:hypothetical protein [Pseudocyphellaria aurata]